MRSLLIRWIENMLARLRRKPADRPMDGARLESFTAGFQQGLAVAQEQSAAAIVDARALNAAQQREAQRMTGSFVAVQVSPIRLPPGLHRLAYLAYDGIRGTRAMVLPWLTGGRRPIIPLDDSLGQMMASLLPWCQETN
jgi:hypothetical protein